MKLQAHAQQTMKKFTALVGRLFLFFSRPTAVRGLLIEHKIPVSMRIQLAKTLYGSARAD